MKSRICIGSRNRALTQKLFCPACGRSFRKLNSGNNQYWVSVLKDKEECSCHTYKIYEKAVYDSFSLLCYKLKDNREIIVGALVKQLNHIQDEHGNRDAISEIDKKIAQLCAQNHVIIKLHNNGILGAADYAEQSSEINTSDALWHGSMCMRTNAVYAERRLCQRFARDGEKRSVPAERGGTHKGRSIRLL